MDAVVKFLQPYQLHPVVDHFSVALLFLAVLIDLFAGSSPTRIWLRYTAVLLMILGALAAGGSFLTGDMEADRIWNALGQPARDVLHRHAQLGTYLAITFGVLAIWRIFIQAFGFMAGSRAIYLIVAILAVATLGYQSHLGGVLVYDYGAGTALMASAPVPSEAASPSSASSSSEPLPTVSVPTPMATATPMATFAAPATNPASIPTPVPTVAPSASPSAASM
ncbi:MAG TPA: DUF2231 domain-containing protein [Candidatus Binatus sp.]|uniref:DUF2231 domain-containing protein n=1 Tax=Candidatus Binatus sp. TaxID=2811406 RepID=UPI002F40E9BA